MVDELPRRSPSDFGHVIASRLLEQPSPEASDSPPRAVGVPGLEALLLEVAFYIRAHRRAAAPGEREELLRLKLPLGVEGFLGFPMVVQSLAHSRTAELLRLVVQLLLQLIGGHSDIAAARLGQPFTPPLGVVCGYLRAGLRLTLR